MFVTMSPPEGDETAMGTGVRFACITHGGPRPRGSARVPNQIKALSVESGGLEPCRCSRPVRDAAPQSLPQSSAVTGSRPTLALVYMLTGGPRCAGPGLRAHRSGPRCAGHGRRAHRLPQIRPDVLDAPDFVGIGAKPARQDGQRGRRNGGAVSLGTLPAGTTEAQVDDMMMVLEVAGEACPPQPGLDRT